MILTMTVIASIRKNNITTLLEFAGHKNNSARTTREKYCHSSLHERLQSCQHKTDYKIKDKDLSIARIMAVKVLCNKIYDC